jgi:energy-coupling factor transport system ATP-binding protein
MSRLAVKIKGLNCRYEKTRPWIFQDLGLSIRREEVMLLLGPSGCGKSTLSLCLKGLIPITIPAEIRGSIEINGENAVRDEPNPDVGIVFQDPESQTVMPRTEEEVAFGLENLGLDPQLMRGRIERALSVMGLSGVGPAPVESLSRGQKQLLALGSVLAMEPSFLILDEPTANLDPRGSVEFFAALKRLKETGITVLLIEHRIDQILDLVDRVMILDSEGRLLRAGTPFDVFGGDTAYLEEAGIWMPTPCRIARKLSGYGIRIRPNPLSLDEADKSFGILRKSKKPSHIERKPFDHSPEAVRVKSLRFAYRGGPSVLENLTFMVRLGELHALVGANGSGKSTLAKILCGLLHEESGDVWILGEPARMMKRSDYARYVGYVFQNPEHQFVTEKVADELSFSLRRYCSRQETTRRVEELLATFGLDGLAGQNPFSLSQGQKRRLSVATMIALGQQILILDEPTFGLDQAGSHKVMEMLRTLHNSGKTIILITHDMQLVLEYAESVSVLGGKRILFRGHPHDLFLRPELLASTGLNPPLEIMLGQRLGDPLLFARSGWVEHLAHLLVGFRSTIR